MLYVRAVLVVVLVFLSVSGCKSQSQITANAIGCETAEVEIIDSEFKRQGSLTTWCARCGNRFYQCITNPSRDHIECRRVPVGPPCE